jgi:hypothetical protein
MNSMTKPNCWFTPLGLLLLFLLCLVPAGQAQILSTNCVPVSQNPAASFQLGERCIFNSASGSVGAFPAHGLTYWQVFFVPSGTVSGATLSLDSSSTGLSGSWSTGGVVASATIGALTSAGSYANSSATTPTNYLQLTPSITGSGNVTVIVFGYTNNPAASAGGGTVSVSNFPSTQPVSLASAPTTPTQPAGFGALIGFQQAVTASAVALATNASHSFCVQALPANTITVYVGPSGITTSTGFPLQAGQTACWSLSNTNLVYVIASTTGASVAVTGT